MGNFSNIGNCLPATQEGLMRSRELEKFKILRQILGSQSSNYKDYCRIDRDIT
jgi:hypothetical protein